MSNKYNGSIPNWVRCYICVIASTSVLALVIAACLGADINMWLSAAVGGFALKATSAAFLG